MASWYYKISFYKKIIYVEFEEREYKVAIGSPPNEVVYKIHDEYERDDEEYDIEGYHMVDRQPIFGGKDKPTFTPNDIDEYR